MVADKIMVADQIRYIRREDFLLLLGFLCCARKYCTQILDTFAKKLTNEWSRKKLKWIGKICQNSFSYNSFKTGKFASSNNYFSFCN